jgi:hypothetical protein
MSAQQISFRITGVRPLLMHSSRLVDPLDPISIDLARLTSKRAKTAADHEEIARTEWIGGLWTRAGAPCIPAEAIESAILAGAKTKRKGKQMKAGFLCNEAPLLNYDGPRGLEELWADKQFRFRHPVQVNDSRTMRTRPRFPKWHIDVNAQFLPSLLNRDDVVEFLEIAGFREGLGDWRPKFGRFKVELLE